MIEIKPGQVKKKLFFRSGICGYLVDIEDREEKAICYPALVGSVEPGDKVLLNTTAVSLELGTGGYHYIIANLSGTGKDAEGGGHIMKMRYTPQQIKVMSVEEEESPYHKQMAAADSLDNIPVIVCSLHSMLAPLCLYLAQERIRPAYVMTDGGALPLVFSQAVDWLKQQQLLAGTVTVGHAFGGDLEAVNIFSGLLAAKVVFVPDVIIVAMGPGIVGTGTRWGFSGVEQGQVIDAVNALNGRSVAVPRISFADPRERHKGISHHTLTVLSRVCHTEAILPIPWLEDRSKMGFLQKQLADHNLLNAHQCCVEDGHRIIPLIKSSELKMTTMGRGIDEDQEFFLTLGAAAATVIKLINKQGLSRLV
ncbi:MAG: DUF3866 family protein [Syntrophomonadaceae bacterium]